MRCIFEKDSLGEMTWFSLCVLFMRFVSLQICNIEGVNSISGKSSLKRLSLELVFRLLSDALHPWCLRKFF